MISTTTNLASFYFKLVSGKRQRGQVSSSWSLYLQWVAISLCSVPKSNRGKLFADRKQRTSSHKFYGRDKLRLRSRKLCSGSLKAIVLKTHWWIDEFLEKYPHHCAETVFWRMGNTWKPEVGSCATRKHQYRQLKLIWMPCELILSS